MISIIIVSYNTKELLHQCLTALYQEAPKSDFEVFVVDNNSTDGSAEMVTAFFPQVILMQNSENRGFAVANNQAWLCSQGEYILLLNPDAFVTSGAINTVVEFMEQYPDCGICGGRLVKPDGSLDPSARKFPNTLSKFMNLSGLHARFPTSRLFSGHEFGHCEHNNADHNHAIEVDWVPGTFTVYRKEMLEQTGLFDERFFIYYEETDLCRTAVKQGWKVYCLPSARVIHVGGASSQKKKDEIFDQYGSQVLKFRMRSEWLYYRKNNGIFAVIGNAGIEFGWHGLRWLINAFPGKKNGSLKQKVSFSVMSEIINSLRDTRFGRLAPPIPW